MVRDGRLELPTSCSQSKRATNCANPGFLVIEFCARCGQTCGQAVFLTISACGGSACIVDISRDCGHGIFRLEGGATRSQTRRDTNFAIPGYSISAIIPRRGRKSKIFLSVVIPVVKAAFVPFSATGKNLLSPVSQGFAAFRLAPSRIPPRHSQSGCPTNWAMSGYSGTAAPVRGRGETKALLPMAALRIGADGLPG